MTLPKNLEQYRFRFAVPDSPDYKAAVATFNLAADVRPVTATIARSTQDVQRAITGAASIGLPILPYSTGHAAALIAPIADQACVINVALDTPVRVDPIRGTVTIPAGTRWGTVIEEAAKFGFAVAHGSSPTVGAIGFLLGGGMSFYGRSVGVAANSVLSITIALADGTVVTVDHLHDPDLFWALRGGGGGFGVVLSVEMRLLPMWKVISGSTFWDASHASVIAPVWREWTASAPRDVATSLRLMQLPDLPMVPEIFRGRQILMLDGAVQVPQETDLDRAWAHEAQLLEPLRTLAEPLAETWQLNPVTELTAAHMDPVDPLPSQSDHFSIAGAGDEAMLAWVEAAGPGSGSILAVSELRQLGGAFSEDAPDGGAVSSFAADFAVLNVGILAPPARPVTIRYDADRIREALAPYDTGLTMPTFVEERSRPRRSFSAEVEEQVDQVRSRVDPDGLFRLDIRHAFQPA